MQSIRTAVPLIASLLLIVLACAWLEALGSGPLSLLGKVVAAAGLAGAVYYTMQMFRARRDPYDLSRLWDTPPADPELPDRETEDDALILCHRCGTSMPAHIGICPECGNRLGY
jgi:hypothetical protein